MGPVRDRTHADGLCSQQEPRLMGPVTVGPKVILGFLGARPNLIYSPWV